MVLNNRSTNQGEVRMSLEAALQANTAAIIALTQALESGVARGKQAEASKPEKVPATVKTESAVTQTTAAAPVAPQPSVTNTAESVASGGPTTATLKLKILELAAKNEALAIQIMAKFGGTLTKTKTEQYPALYAELTAALSPSVPGGLV